MGGGVQFISSRVEKGLKSHDWNRRGSSPFGFAQGRLSGKGREKWGTQIKPDSSVRN
jgi:hypothetical protein